MDWDKHNDEVFKSQKHKKKIKRSMQVPNYKYVKQN